MTYAPNKPTVLDLDNTSGDAFGRLRISQPVTEFDSKQLFDKSPLFWDEALESGAGISSAHSTDEAATTLTSTVSTAGLFTRRTRQRFNYQPGKSQLIMMTGALAPTAGATGVTRRLGQFDDSNGLFFADTNGVVSVAIRSSTSGSPVETPVSQSSWNIDPMDGSGQSGVTIDWSFSQIFVIDYEWLSVGRARFGVVIDGVICYVHAFRNANSLPGAYMSTPNLPLTYQLETTSAAPVASLVHICTSVVSEGGSQDLGVLRYKSTEGVFVNANTVNVLYVVMGLRLKTTHLDAVVNTVSSSVVALTADDFEWVLMFNPTISGSLSWTGMADSAVEFSIGDGTQTITGDDADQITGGFAAESTSVSAEIHSPRYMGSAIDGTRDEVLLAVRPLSSNLDIDGGMTWRELL